MKLIIDQAELHRAVIARVNQLGLDTTGKSVVVQIKATRNPTGYSAEIDINELGEEVVVAEVATVTEDLTITAEEHAALVDEDSDSTEETGGDVPTGGSLFGDKSE